MQSQSQIIPINDWPRPTSFNTHYLQRSLSVQQTPGEGDTANPPPFKHTYGRSSYHAPKSLFPLMRLIMHPHTYTSVCKCVCMRHICMRMCARRKCLLCDTPRGSSGCQEACDRVIQKPNRVYTAPGRLSLTRQSQARSQRVLRALHPSQTCHTFSMPENSQTALAEELRCSALCPQQQRAAASV